MYGRTESGAGGYSSTASVLKCPSYSKGHLQ